MEMGWGQDGDGMGMGMGWGQEPLTLLCWHLWDEDASSHHEQESEP